MYNFSRHLRLAGSFLILVSLFIYPRILLAIGLFLISCGYMLSVTITEQYIEEQIKEDK